MGGSGVCVELVVDSNASWGVFYCDTMHDN